MATYQTKEAPGCCLPCQGVETRDWYAWLNLMPHPPDELHVVGEVMVWKPVRHDKVAPGVKYTEINVFCGDDMIARFPVEEVH